jgi:hypothetical protein
MIEALYGLQFKSNQHDFGYGVAVLETNKVLGGDSSFVFIGNYKLENGMLNAEIKCTNDRRLLQSIFGDIDSFNLKVCGNTDNECKNFILKGYMVENPSMEIEIEVTRRAELP